MTAEIFALGAVYLFILVLSAFSPRLCLYVAIVLHFILSVKLVIGPGDSTIRLYPSTFLLTGLLLTLPLHAARWRSDPPRFNSVHFVFVVIYAIELLSLFWSQSTLKPDLISETVQNLMILLLPPFFIRTGGDIRNIVVAFIAAAFLAAVSGACSLYWILEFRITLNDWLYFTFGIRDFSERAAGFTTANFLASTISMGCICLTALIPYFRGVRRYGLYAAFYALCMGLSLTDSRGGIMSMLLATILVIVFSPTLSGRKIRFTMLHVVLFILATFVTNAKFFDTLLVGFGFTGQLTSTEHYAGSKGSGMLARWVWWTGVTGKMLEMPASFIWGLGLGGFYFHNTDKVDPHSTWMQFFFDLGAIGLVLFLLASVVMGSEFIGVLRRSSSRTIEYGCVLGLAMSVVCVYYIHGWMDNGLTHKHPITLLSFTLAALNVLKHSPVQDGFDDSHTSAKLD